MHQITARCPWEDAERWRGEPSPISTTLTGLHGPNPVCGAAQALEQDLLHVANQPGLKLCPASLHTELQPANGLSTGCCSRERGQRGGFWLRCQVPARLAVAGLGGPILRGLSPPGMLRELAGQAGLTACPTLLPRTPWPRRDRGRGPGLLIDESFAVIKKGSSFFIKELWKDASEHNLCDCWRNHSGEELAAQY